MARPQSPKELFTGSLACSNSDRVAFSWTCIAYCCPLQRWSWQNRLFHCNL